MRRMLRRPWKGRLLCGVRMGLAARFTVPVMAVRLAFVGLCLEEIRYWSAEKWYYEEYC